MPSRMIMGEKFKIEVDSSKLHQQARKDIAYEYFSKRYDGQKRMMEVAGFWFGISIISGAVGFFDHSFLGLIAFLLMIISTIMGVFDFKDAVEYNFDSIDWGSKNMVRIDK